MLKSSSSWTTKEHRNKCVQRKKSLIYYRKVWWNMKLWGQGVQRLVSPISKVKNGMRLEGEQDSTQSEKTVTDWYKCGPDSNSTQIDRNMADQYGCAPKTQTQTDKMMTDWYRCGPETQKLTRKVIERWSIDIGLAPTQTEHGRWPIDIGTVPKTQTQNSNWQNEWLIDISTVPTQTQHKQIGIWPINMGVAPTQTDKTKLT